MSLLRRGQHRHNKRSETAATIFDKLLVVRCAFSNHMEHGYFRQDVLCLYQRQQQRRVKWHTDPRLRYTRADHNSTGNQSSAERSHIAMGSVQHRYYRMYILHLLSCVCMRSNGRLSASVSLQLACVPRLSHACGCASPFRARFWSMPYGENIGYQRYPNIACDSC